MEALGIAEPATILGLAAVAIGAVLYGVLKLSDTHKKESELFMNLIKEKDTDYRNFVTDNNHKMTDTVKEFIETNVTVRTAIENHTRTVERLLDRLEK